MKTILMLLFTVVSMVVFAQDATVVQLEYFFDTDNGVGKNKLVNVAPTADGSFPFTASIAGLSVGYHKLYIRTKDSNGKWSLPTRSNVEIFAPYAKTNVVNGEYFIDSDPGFGSGTSIAVSNPDSIVLQNFAAVNAGLATGYHKLYIRTKDSNGKWSLATRRNIEVFAPYAKTNVVSGEYFIDTDPGYGSGMPITVATPDSAILQNFNAVTSGLSVGYHKLYGRFKDDHGRWSLTFRRNIEVYKNDTNYIYNAEYFFKTDNGYGNCTAVKLANPSVDGTFSFNIPLNQIPAGADTLFIRVQDSSENKWSIIALKNISVPLPLTLLNFNVIEQNNTAQLNWQTTNEINTSYFIIQRSADGRSFSNIGKVVAKNSNTLQNDYAYTDNIAQLNADRLFYRLQEVDIDGKLFYSDIKIIYLQKKGVLFTISPNPANDYINIVASDNVTNAKVAVTDMNGRTLYTVKHNFNAGEQIKIPAAQFAKQILIVTISTDSSKQEFKVVKE